MKLRELNHDIQMAPTGISNGRALALAAKSHRILLTQDNDFANTTQYPPAKFSGILLIPDSAVVSSPRRKPGSRLQGKLDTGLRRYDGTEKSGDPEGNSVSTAEFGLIRIHPPLLEDMLKALVKFLSSTRPKSLKGKLAILDKKSFHIFQ